VALVGLFGVVAAAVLAGLLAPADRAGAEPSWLAGCGPKQADTVRVALVIDFGTEPDAPQGIEVACVVVPTGSRGDTVLVTWAKSRQQGIRTQGLVCGIAGYPATGCGEATESGYLYWSYWYDGPTGWTYASVGPAGHTVRDCSVEGWRFVRGAGNPSDPPPRVAMPSTDCSTPVSSTTTSSTTTTPAAVLPPAQGTPPPAGAAPFVPSSSLGGTETVVPPPTPGEADASATSSAEDATTDVPIDEVADPETGDTVAIDDDQTATAERAGGPDAEVALTQASLSTDSSSGSSAVPTLVGVGLIAGLAGVALVRFRRGART